MDPVVTARVPAGVRQRGLEVLHEIGATTSELVNAYVIQERELPKPRTAAAPEPGRRSLGAKQKRELAAFLEGVRAPAPREWSSVPFEQLLSEAVEERYADLR